MPLQWIDSLANYFGYQKIADEVHVGKVATAQSKPNSFPQQLDNRNPSLTNNENLDPYNSMPTGPMGGGQPEQQSGNPGGQEGMGNGAVNPNSPTGSDRKPEVEIKNSVEVPTPFSPADRSVNTGTPTSSQGPDINPTSLKPQFTTQDMDAYHPKLGKVARELGILSVDKELFLDKYNSHVKKAASLRKPLSDYFDEIL